MRSFILGVASGVIASAMIVGVMAAWADHLDYSSSRPTMSEAAVYTVSDATIGRASVICDGFTPKALDQLRDIAK